MEKKTFHTQPHPQPSGNTAYTVHGSQIVFKNVEDYGPFKPNLNYVVDTRNFSRLSRKVRSLEIRRTDETADECYKEIQARKGEALLLKDIVVEVDREAKEEKKIPAIVNQRSSKPISKWSVLRSVVHAVNLFRTSEAQIINNEVLNW